MWSKLVIMKDMKRFKVWGWMGEQIGDGWADVEYRNK